MAHNLDMTNGRANMAFLGDRKDIWHKLGQSKKPGASVESWRVDAGLNWEAIKVPAIASLAGPEFNHLAHNQVTVKDRNFIVRSDNGAVLGYASNRYQPVQPAEVLDWFERYISVDPRFQLDVAGSLRDGAIIWATATFNGAMNVAGDQHVARLLMTTTFDGSGATLNKGTMTRVVCNNTLDAALSDARCTVRTRHSTKFDAKQVSDELARVAKGFETYKLMGDAMAQANMTVADLADFFKDMLDIPHDAKEEDISTRKANQYKALAACYKTTAAEGARGNAWAALNTITRYVDHERHTARDDAARFDSAQFGSGAQIKARAVDLLLPRIGGKEAAAWLAAAEARVGSQELAAFEANAATKLSS